MTPEVSITAIGLTTTSVYVTWELVQGTISSLSLGWTDTTSVHRNRRSTDGDYTIIQSDIPPNQSAIFVMYNFSLSVTNEFVLFAYEEGISDPTGQSPHNQGVVLVSIAPGK